MQINQLPIVISNIISCFHVRLGDDEMSLSTGKETVFLWGLFQPIKGLVHFIMVKYVDIYQIDGKIGFLYSSESSSSDEVVSPS